MTLTLALAALCLPSAHADGEEVFKLEEIHLQDGKVYRQAQGVILPDRKVKIYHETGIAVVELYQLPDDLRAQLQTPAEKRQESAGEVFRRVMWLVMDEVLESMTEALDEIEEQEPLFEGVETLVLSNGRVYRQATGELTKDGRVSIQHDSGIATVDSDLLPAAFATAIEQKQAKLAISIPEPPQFWEQDRDCGRIKYGWCELGGEFTLQAGETHQFRVPSEQRRHLQVVAEKKPGADVRHTIQEVLLPGQLDYPLCPTEPLLFLRYEAGEIIVTLTNSGDHSARFAILLIPVSEDDPLARYQAVDLLPEDLAALDRTLSADSGTDQEVVREGADTLMRLLATRRPGPESVAELEQEVKALTEGMEALGKFMDWFQR